MILTKRITSIFWKATTTLAFLLCLTLNTIQAQNIESLRDSLGSNPDFAITQLTILLNEDLDDTNRYLANYFIGKAYQTKVEYNKALEYYGNAVEIALELNDTFRIYDSRNQVGWSNFYQGEYQESFEVYFENYKMLAESKDCRMVPTSILNVANLYYYQHKKVKSLEMQYKAHAKAVLCRDTHVLQTSCRNISAIYTEIPKPDSAIYWMRKGMGYLAPDDYSTRANTTSILAANYKYPEQKELMYQTFREAIELAEKSRDSTVMAFTYLKITGYFIQENQIDSARYYSSNALMIYRRAKMADGIMHALSYLTAVSDKEKDPEVALKLYKELFLIRDTLVDEITTIKTAELETLYETEKKEKENLKLKAENVTSQALVLEERNKSNLILFFTILTILLIVGIAIVLFYRVKLKTKNELNKLEKEKTNAVIVAEEKERIRIARELHDGIGQQMSGLKLQFSNFVTQYLPTNSEEEKNAQKLLNILDDSCSEVRSISHQMMPRTLKELGLVKALESMLEKSLNGTNIKYQFEHFKVDERFESRIENSLYRICQELVNNIMKHSQANQISVQLFKNKSSLILIVEDNGIGFNSTEKKNGIGLLNMSSRIDTINGKINFESSPGSGTTATIRVPLDK
ncbi:MAG: ATP-binding protein [Salibacteraceae bacterium]